MKVAIVEDEEILMKVLKEKLEKSNFEVRIAMDGEEAMPMIEKQKPDLVILDLMLPQKNGFEVLKELKSNPEMKGIPVIVLSNLGQDEEIKKALLLGAADYMVKAQHPIKEVVEKVKSHLIKAK